jgi:hypothetical protein
MGRIDNGFLVLALIYLVDHDETDDPSFVFLFSWTRVVTIAIFLSALSYFSGTFLVLSIPPGANRQS